MNDEHTVHTPGEIDLWTVLEAALTDSPKTLGITSVCYGVTLDAKDEAKDG